MIDKIREILTSNTDVRILYDGEVIYEIDNEYIYSEHSSHLISELDYSFISFFKYTEVEVPSNIFEFYKMLNKIKKTLENENPKYHIIMNEQYVIISEEELEEFYDLYYLRDNIDSMEIFEIKYLDATKI